MHILKIDLFLYNSLLTTSKCISISLYKQKVVRYLHQTNVTLNYTNVFRIVIIVIITLFIDGTDFGRLSIASILKLIILLLCEDNAEHADNVSIRNTGVDISLNGTLLLLDEEAK